MGKDPEKTRSLLLEKAYEEIHLNGFQGTSITKILDGTSCTKGALYHHFKNKNEIGYAIVDEIIREEIQRLWIQPLEQSDDPVTTILKIIENIHEEMSPEMMRRGCPLNNLIQEMAPIDPVFKEKLAQVMGEWRSALADALSRGIEAKTISVRVKPQQVAQFIIVIIEGVTSILKNTDDLMIIEQCTEEFIHYLLSLQPAKQGKDRK